MRAEMRALSSSEPSWKTRAGETPALPVNGVSLKFGGITKGIPSELTMAGLSRVKGNQSLATTDNIKRKGDFISHSHQSMKR